MVFHTSSSYYPKGNSHAERAVGVVKEIYAKCGNDFLLGLLVHRATPLLYPNAKSPAEMFLGRRIAINIPCIPFGTAALIQCSDDHDQVCTFDPKEGDSCWSRLNSTENVWNKGLVIRKVIGVPESYVVEVDGCRYHRNKRDLTLRPPSKRDSDSHQSDQDAPMAGAVMPTLRPRLQLKFPKFPVQATQQKDFNL